MKYFLSILFFNLIILLSANSQDYNEQKEITKKVIGFFISGQYADIHGLFDDQMKLAISSQRLEKIWNSLPIQCGKFLAPGDVIVTEMQEMIVVNQLLDFENVDLDIRLALNSNNQISGLFFVPPVKKKVR